MRSHKYRSKSRHASDWRAEYGVALAVVCMLTVGMATRQWRAAATSESICVSLRVIGLDNGDPGDGGCVAQVPSSSEESSLSSSPSSSASSASSFISSSASQTSQEDRGAYRITRDWIGQRIRDLLDAWFSRASHPAPPSFARCITYTDVPDGAWYERAVCDFIHKGYLDTAQMWLRPADNATRAEMAALLVRMKNEAVYLPDDPGFEDVRPNAWYYGVAETAARYGWMIGYGNCYGTHPCYDRPAAGISRAEAAALAVRFFRLKPLGLAPAAPDITANAWYEQTVRIAADHCILLGDAESGRVRPDDAVTRAEMIVMLWRGEHALKYGADCQAGQKTL